MPIVTMPRLSDSMEEGIIVRWLVGEGDKVACGMEIAEIETDKATMGFESEFDGILRIIAGEGEVLAVGAVIARIEPADGDSSAPPKRAAEQAAASPSTTTPAPAQATRPALVHSGETASDARVNASPAARRIAQTLGVDLAAVTGTGPSGRVAKRDVVSAAERLASPDLESVEAPVATDSVPASLAVVAPPHDPEPRAGSASRKPAAPDVSKGKISAQQLSRVQAIIARRMTEAKGSMPEFTLEIDVDMDAALSMRAEMRTLAGAGSPSLNDFAIRACALALRDHPHANGAYREGRFELYERINVGMAVATRDALIVPTVFDADRRSLAEIARETRRLTVAAREGTLSATDLASGTFTISNLGMYGVTSFTAVLNPPQAAILAIGAVEQRAVARGGALVAAHLMSLTLTCDHRILYGAEAAQFLADVRANLETPLRLTL